jgi:hypothetical protein
VCHFVARDTDQSLKIHGSTSKLHGATMPDEAILLEKNAQLGTE